MRVARGGSHSGPKRVLRIFLVLAVLGTSLFFVKKSIDNRLEKRFSTYENEVALYKKKNASVSREIDTLNALFSDVDKSVATLEKSVAAIREKSLNGRSVDSALAHTVDTLSLAFLTSYSDTLASFMKVFSEKIDERGNLFNTVPVIPPISVDDLFTQERGFGSFKDPFTGRITAHNGLDFAAAIGTPVIATANGYVKSVEEHRFWGKRIVIQHKSNFKTYYAHLGTISVRQGKKVKKGDTIGTVGESGLSTGPHVHYELYHKDKAVDPERYLLLKEIR